jgi:aquaporin Z
MFVGAWTGASLNPARTMGPAIAYPVDAVFGTLWLYWAAPLIGGAIAGITNAWLRNDMPKGAKPDAAPEAPAP